MKTKYGKFYARWTGADGKRHEKACDTKAAAKKLQAKMQAERETKKAQATARPSAKSVRPGARRQATAPGASSPKPSTPKPGISRRRS